MAAAPAELADIMEPHLYGDLLHQATTLPVNIQVQGRIWRTTGQPGLQPSILLTDRQHPNKLDNHPKDLLVLTFLAPQLGVPVALAVERDAAHFKQVLGAMAYRFVTVEVSGMIPYRLAPQTWLERHFKISN